MYTPKTIVWTDDFKTGDSHVDFQHRYLLNALNKLGEAILEDYWREGVMVALGKLKFYSEWHFQKEEEIMNLYQCSAAELNKSEHKKFTAMLDDYEKYLKQNTLTRETALELHNAMSNWVCDHVLEVDMTLRDCIGKQE